MQTPPTPPASRPRSWWRAYPKTITVFLLIVAALLVVDGMTAARWWRYRDEVARLRAGMTEAERQHADLVLSSEQHRMRVMLELVRRQARGDRELHLEVSVDSGRMYLKREGVLMRTMTVRIGPGRLVGTGADTVRLVAPRGARTIERVLTARDVWEVPRWVFEERGLTVPDDRNVQGALGNIGVILTGGALLYAVPTEGPLADTSFVLPGSVRLDPADLKAIAPNLAAGVSVYFY
jgi:hypothetical protein